MGIKFGSQLWFIKRAMFPYFLASMQNVSFSYNIFGKQTKITLRKPQQTCYLQAVIVSHQIKIQRDHK